MAEKLQRLLSTEDLAELCGVPVATVHRWAYTGSGPPRLKIGRYSRYDVEDVRRWLKGRRATGDEEGGR